MSHTTHDTESGETTVIDLTARLTPEARDRIAADARTAVQATEHGITDLATGTIRLNKPTADPDGEPVEGVVLEQLDTLDDDPRWQTRQLLPEALTDPAARRHRVKVLTNHAEFHALRSPVYLWRIAKVTAIGARTAIRDTWNYEQAGEYGAMIDQARRKGLGDDHIAALRAERRQVRRERHREPTTVLSASGATSYVAALVAIAQVWGVAMAAPVLLLLFLTLFILGRRELIRRAPDGGEVFTITDLPAEAGRAPLGAESINDAFRRAGVMKADEEVTLVGPVRAVEIHAAEAVIDLPGDLTVSALIKDREKIAAAFRVEPTWIDFRTAGHPGRCRLWVASEDPFSASRPSPLLADLSATDVWNAGIPIGYNRRGELVRIRLRHVMALLGGMSRTGKGMLLRNLICGLGLDPRVNIRLIAGAKPGEHRGYGPVCATFFGRRPERLVVLLDALLAEAYRREAYLEGIGRAKLGEKDLNQFPLEILIIDEAKQYLRKGGSLADRIIEQLEELAAFAAALNITVLLSTQDPDANTIPRGYKSNSGARVATRTGGSVQTNAILKDGATGAGLRAHEIPESLKGGAIVDIDGAPGELIRSFFIEDEAYDGAEPIITAAVALRKAAGRLPGQFDDPIEAALIDATGTTSVAGGPSGSGRPDVPVGAASGRATGILGELLAVFEAAGNPPHLRTADLLAGLACLAPEPWARVAAGDARTAGRELGRAIAAGLREGRELTSRERSWGRGYLLDEVRTAAGIAPK
jgi:S-DNA-T family DNA segregation ATPase FtsK/SpoIIIE